MACKKGQSLVSGGKRKTTKRKTGKKVRKHSRKTARKTKKSSKGKTFFARLFRL